MINYINNSRTSSIITLEDPIEYLFEPKKSIIIQRQLGSDMKSFAKGLKHVLRQDPDVIMVGEMRDLETISTTITLAETGHLVLATLHTYSASQTIDRIIDIFPPHQQNQVRMQLSMTLAGVISQRLLPKIKGGRIAAREILINTPPVSNLIRENKIAQIRSVIETSLKDGMESLDRVIQEYYKNNIISKEVAQGQMTNPETLEKFKIF
jgi:twitching motility protein PilT